MTEDVGEGGGAEAALFWLPACAYRLSVDRPRYSLSLHKLNIGVCPLKLSAEPFWPADCNTGV